MREFVGRKTPVRGDATSALRTSDASPPAQALQAKSSDDSFRFDKVSVLPPSGGAPMQQPTTQPATSAPASVPAMARQPLHYLFFDHWYLNPVPKDKTISEIKSAPDFRSLKSVEIRPKPLPKTFPDAERSLLWALLRVSHLWGSELDLIAPMESGEKGKVPTALVTVRIEWDGAASVELLSQTLSTPKPLTAATPAEELISTFGFASVRDEDSSLASWTEAELVAVVEAVRMIPPEDVPALGGVELIRVREIAGGASGSFMVGGGITPDGKSVEAKPALRLADKAFKGKYGFGGGKSGAVPALYMIILHEIAHAVERFPYRAAKEDLESTSIAMNTAGLKYWELDAQIKDTEQKKKDAETAKKKEKDKTKKKEIEAEIAALKETKKEQEAGKKQAGADYFAAKKDLPAKEDALKKTRVTSAGVKPLKDAMTPKRDAAANALSDAQSVIATAYSMLGPKAKAGIDVYRAALESTANAISKFEKDTEELEKKMATSPSQVVPGMVDTLETPVLDKIAIRGAGPPSSSSSVSATLTVATTAQDEWFKAASLYARAVVRTTRLQKFIDLVETNKIEPFTDYAKKQWPREPYDFYAEAYALWITDPDFLEHEYPEIFKFFQSGDYRS